MFTKKSAIKAYIRMDNFPLEFDLSFWELFSVIVKVMLSKYQLYAR